MDTQTSDTHRSPVECVQRLQRAEGMLVGKLNGQVRPFGLSVATVNVLTVLLRAGRSLSPCEIGEELLVTRGTVTGLIDSLERRQLVRRLAHPDDRRMLLIELTDEGRGLMEQLMPEQCRMMAELLACLSDSERDAFVQALGKIEHHLAQYGCSEA